MRPMLLLTLLSVAPLSGCRQSPSAAELTAADSAAIRATTDRWLAAVRAGRPEDAAATYTTDATLSFPKAEFKGRAAIQKFYEAMPVWDSTAKLYIDEIRGHGDMVFVAGHSTGTPAGGGAPVVKGRYLDIRLRQPDGTWLYYRDMVTPVPPPE